MKELFLGACVAVWMLTACNGSTMKGNNADSTIVASGLMATEPALPAGHTSSRSVAEYEIPARLKDRPEQILRRKGYTVSYNKETRTPNWVAWHLTKSHTYGNHQRNRDMFAEDETVARPRATDNDYYNSRYDRGHMCPAGDNKWDAQAMRETFLLTNICPQNHNLNKYEWNDIEILCRSWARQYGAVDVVCGPVYYRGEAPRTIGRNKVRVPDAFFKVVLCRNSGAKAMGFVYKNTGRKQNVYDCVRSVDEIEKLTGIDFFPVLQDDVEAEVEGQSELKEWKPSYPTWYK